MSRHFCQTELFQRLLVQLITGGGRSGSVPGGAERHRGLHNNHDIYLLIEEPRTLRRFLPNKLCIELIIYYDSYYNLNKAKSSVEDDATCAKPVICSFCIFPYETNLTYRRILHKCCKFVKADACFKWFMFCNAVLIHFHIKYVFMKLNVKC